MPTYVYACRDCDERIEVFQRITDAPLSDCGRCGGSGSLRRVLFPPAVVYKGTGFYTTDYKNNGRRSEEGSGSDSGGSSGEKRSDSSGA